VNCYLCGEADPAVIRTKLRHDVRRNVLKCGRCGLAYLEPNDQDLQAFYADDYRSTYSPKPGHPLSSQEIFDTYLPFQQDRVDRILPRLNPLAVALEVGCSAGHFMHLLRPHVGECIGIEFNLNDAKFVNENLGIKTYSEPIEKTDIPHGSLDLLCAFHVMEHMEDPVGFLRSARPYLRKGSLLYVEVPNIDDALISLYGCEPFEDFWYREPHMFNFSPKTLEMTLGKAGFSGEIHTIQRYGFLNHVHWLQTGRGQPTVSVGMNQPVLVEKHKESLVAAEINGWMSRMDREYRALLNKHRIGDSMVFIGTMQ